MKKGKGYTKYYYTLADVANAAQTEVNTIRQHILRGKFDPRTLASVVEYVLTRRESGNERNR